MRILTPIKKKKYTFHNGNLPEKNVYFSRLESPLAYNRCTNSVCQQFIITASKISISQSQDQKIKKLGPLIFLLWMGTGGLNRALCFISHISMRLPVRGLGLINNAISRMSGSCIWFTQKVFNFQFLRMYQATLLCQLSKPNYSIRKIWKEMLRF